MSKQLTQIRSQDPQELTRPSTLSTAVILKEQKEPAEAVRYIAKLIDRIAFLYQIPNWSVHNSVVLAEWTFENYKWDSLETIELALKNPSPQLDEDGKVDRNWRLTPDSIAHWMHEWAERDSIKKENEENAKKAHDLPKEGKGEEGYINFYKEKYFNFPASVINKPEEKKQAKFVEDVQKLPSKPMTEDEVKEWERIRALKMEYGKNFCDMYTGRPYPGVPTFDEWLKAKQ
jgi:hypothetical protein